MILTNWPRLILFLSFILILTVLSIPNDSKMGVIYFKSFKYDEALKYFDQAKSTNKQSPLILKKIKDYFIIEGDIDKALISQKKITELLPKNIWHWKELIKLYNWNNMPYKALKAQVKVAPLLPAKNKYKYLLNISKGYQWLRKWDDATKLGKVILESNNPKILEENLQYFLAIGNTDMIIKHIYKLEKITKNTTLYKYYLAQAYMIKKDYKNAIISLLVYFGGDSSYKNDYQTANFLDKSTDYIFKKIQIINEIINLYEKLGDELSIAKIYAKLYQINSEKYDIGLDAAEIFVKHKLNKEASQILKKIYTVRSASRLYRAANIYLEYGKEDLAIIYMEKAIKLYPYKSEYYEDLTYLYEKKGLKRKALNLQLKLLKMLKRNIKSSIYYINQSELLIAQNGNIRLPSNKIDKVKETRNKIIQLMEELGENDNKHKQLLELNKENPHDLNSKKMLAYSYLDRNEYKKARVLFIEINKISPFDKDVAIFVVDDLLNKNNEELAYPVIKPFLKDNDVSIRSRLFSIYTKTNPKQAEQLCANHRLNSIEDFEQVDFKVKCNEVKSNFKNSINILLKYLDIKPKSIQAKIVLCYQFLNDQDIDNAKKLISDLSKENIEKKIIKNLNTYKDQVIVDLKIQKSWENSLNFSNYESQNYSFWMSRFQLYKNTGKLSYGVSLLKAEPNTSNETIGSNSLLLKYHFKEDLVSSFHIGNNFGNSDKLSYGYSINYQWLEQLQLNFIGNIATQIYDIPAFLTATESLRDSQSLYIAYDYNFRNRINFAFEYNHYYLDEYFAKTRLTSIQYNYFLTQHWSPGLFVQKQETYEGDNYLKQLLLQSSNVQALNIKHEYIFFQSKLKNTVDLYLGQDVDRRLSFGDYVSFRENLYYDHSKRKQANFSLAWNKASQNININESLIIQIGYSFWFL